MSSLIDPSTSLLSTSSFFSASLPSTSTHLPLPSTAPASPPLTQPANQ
jgi:hypothetical protein